MSESAKKVTGKKVATKKANVPGKVQAKRPPRKRPPVGKKKPKVPVAKSLDELVRTGAVTINDVRIAHGLAPLPGYNNVIAGPVMTRVRSD